MNNLVFNTVANELKTAIYGLAPDLSVQPIRVDGSGQLLIAGSLTISDNITVSAILSPVTIGNASLTVEVSNASLTVDGQVEITNASLTVDGQVEITNASVTVAGTVTVSAIEAPITIGNASLTVEVSNASLTVDGQVEITNASITVDGQVEITNTSVTVAGTVTVSAIETAVTIANASITVEGQVEITNASITVDGQVEITNASLTVSGTVTIAEVSAPITIGANAFFELSEAGEVTGTGVIFPDTDISTLKTATIFVYNDGTATITLSLQYSPVPSDSRYIDDPNYTDVEIDPGEGMMISVSKFAHYVRLQYNMGVEESVMFAAFNGQA